MRKTPGGKPEAVQATILQAIQVLHHPLYGSQVCLAAKQPALIEGGSLPEQIGTWDALPKHEARNAPSPLVQGAGV